MTISSGSMSFKAAEEALEESFSVHIDDGNETFERLELAAAQVAICLSVWQTAIEIPEVDDIRKRVEGHRVSVMGNNKSGDETFDVQDILSTREHEFYNAARTIVGLIYHAARENTQTISPEPAIRRTSRRSAVL